MICRVVICRKNKSDNLLKQINSIDHWLSYLVEQSVEKVSSTFNSSLEVTLHKGKFKLNTANAIYSYEELYRSFAVTFKAIDIESEPVNDVLMLGLGLGSIPTILKKNHHCEPNFVAIEIDPEVVRLANKYNNDLAVETIEILCQDGFDHVMNSESTYDLIAVDLFFDDKVPEKFEDDKFLHKLAALLNDKGIILFNRMATNNTLLEATELFFQEHFRKVFPTSKVLVIGGNRMLVYDRR